MNYLPDLPQIVSRCLLNGCVFVAMYWLCFALYHRLDIHKKYGIFRVREPEVHYHSALSNWKIPFFWGVGTALAMMLFGFKFNAPLGNNIGLKPELVFTLPPEYIFLHSPNLLTDILYGVVGFYLVDFFDYWAHRLNHHYPFLYKKFPFAHFVHHNWIFINPTVLTSSPVIHLASLTGFSIYALMLSQGLVLPLAVLHLVKLSTNYSSHLGCDPLPWLTRLNHRVGGWIPWIPVHHQYHHLHFTRQGNYGNLTCLWDYVFGTVIPESAYHIENGRPTEAVAARMERSEAQMEAELGRYLQGKLGLSLK